MSDLALRVDHLSKSYRIAHAQPGQKVGHYKTLQEDLLGLPRGLWTAVRGRNGAGHETVWALKDISFEVKRGEVIGIIGSNGAGKSTLLKILSRITEPTEGRAEVYGRVGSLLEVGTGFHPELTGRENTYLNGAILGMKRTEIDRKFDEIVAFSGVEKFIDTPAKYLSSGMHVRLAFSVAAHLDPEILLVDEVLAVGDAEFQRKCLDKMKDVTQEGRTVLFVSHNMAAVRNLCPRTVLVERGRIAFDGPTDQAIITYLDRNLQDGAIASEKDIEGILEGVILRNNPTIRFKEIALIDQQGEPRNLFQSDEAIQVSIAYECFTTVNDLRVLVQVVDEENRPILTTQNSDDVNATRFYHQEPGVYKSSCVIPRNTFGEKRFYISLQLEYPKVEHLILNKALRFDVSFRGYNNLLYGSSLKDSFLRPLLSWETQRFDGKDQKID